MIPIGIESEVISEGVNDLNRLATFRRGGVHPDDKKALSKDKKLEKLPLPKEIVVSMSQHLGAPATLVKKKGDEVKRGEVIGEESGYISASVHSPVDGIIKDIKKSLSSEEIVKLIREMGIVGMGGATFPTAVKVTIPMGKEVDALVINGVECEPYLTSDYRLMMEKPDEVLEGVMVAAKAVNPKRIIIGIEANKMDAVSVISSRIAADNLPIEVMPLKTKYPQGDEKQLLKATIGKEVPSGKLPLDVGAVVCNLGTCFALYEAAVFHKPLIERVITVSGEGINEPKNLIAPIGTKFSDLIAYCGGEKEDAAELVAGGPMMGFAVSDADTPMVKGSGGLLSLPLMIDDFTAPCVLCGKCVQHCPMGLQPNKMFRNIKYGNYQAAMDLGLMDCKECGCCAYTCPSHLPLVQGFKLGKKMGRKKK